MNNHGVGQTVQGFTSISFGAVAAGRATNGSMSGEWMRALAPVAQRQLDADVSPATAWIMIVTILSTLAIMVAVVIATAASVS